jgi:MinD superfamily P-loop ATPase
MFWKSKEVALVMQEKCDGCARCIRICRHHALEMKHSGGKFKSTMTNPDKCSGCGKCIVICPCRAIGLIKKSNN